MVPVFHEFLWINIKQNNLTKRVHLIKNVVHNNPNISNFTLHVPVDAIWGAATIDGLNVDGNAAHIEVIATASTVDAALHDLLSSKEPRTHCLLKVDIEGYEPEAISSAVELRKHFPPEVIALEYSPGMRNKKGPEFAAENPKMLNELLVDYVGYHLPWDIVHQPFKFEDPVTKLEKIKDVKSYTESIGYNTILVLQQKAPISSDLVLGEFP